MVHGVVRPITTQPLLSPPCYNTCGINLVLLTARDRHIMLFLEPIMLCSSSQFCSHYAHATIPIMPALCSNLKDSA